MLVSELLQESKKKRSKRSGRSLEFEPNDPVLWGRAKAEAKRRFKVYPSAYANAFAAKKYKEWGGKWRKVT